MALFCAAAFSVLALEKMGGALQVMGVFEIGPSSRLIQKW
jgi:hypothetical protein